MQRDAVEKFLDLEAQVNDEEDEDDEEERDEMGMYQNLYYILSLTSKFKMSLLSMAPRKRKRMPDGSNMWLETISLWPHNFSG
jgi:hypothetical protein